MGFRTIFDCTTSRWLRQSQAAACLRTVRWRPPPPCRKADFVERGGERGRERRSGAPGPPSLGPVSHFGRDRLGVTWILDGLEVTLAGALAGALKQSPVLHFSNTDVGFVSSAYLAGAVSGALLFGWLTDRWGRKKLFFVTLAVYLAASAATALSWDLPSFALFRFLTGAGIGGEYAAINSTIQEFIPARYRGRTDLAINGSYWLGAAVGAAGSIVCSIRRSSIPRSAGGSRFSSAPASGLIVVFMRLWIPESPRWLMTHGYPARARAVVADIEDRFRRRGRPH